MRDLISIAQQHLEAWGALSDADCTPTGGSGGTAGVSVSVSAGGENDVTDQGGDDDESESVAGRTSAAAAAVADTTAKVSPLPSPPSPPSPALPPGGPLSWFALPRRVTA